ncbi:uncharacterized protein LOC116013440 isoform X1 [Ipomoea triloba]|uniref:uncharacterized protein LOC116013440 isoform X1 n=1 Tax=Ipomoea triloba TaxID=35885 RepID=UPI00125D6F5E|nr:uncharacterized protein LOC116013440 isoform X1 [Ipomoea triloba]XP_031109056.1 uncharacterized protein LOC116013440 isoform X1 [Ipomoea triloba]XP_031109057.1 uncharacterized protein LOC116013440 isoform X1 [Ipomoea triloba]
MDGEENESFGEVEQQLRPGSAAKDLADIWKEIGEIKQKVAEIREIQAKLFEEYVLVDSSQAEDDTQMENFNKDVEEVEPLSSIFAGNDMRKRIGETCSLECRRHSSVVQGTSALLMGISAPRFPRTQGRTGPYPSLA